MSLGEPPSVRKAALDVVEALVRGDYEGLVSRVRSRIDAPALREVVRSYGRTLVPPLPTAYVPLDAVRVRTARKPTWSLEVALWTAEEGRSDLTLRLTVSLRDGAASVELDDLLVP